VSDDAFTFDLEFDVSGHPAARSSSLRLDAAASASLALPGLSLAVDKLLASLGIAVQLDAAGGLRLTPSLVVDQPEGARGALDLPGFTGGGALAHTGDEWRGALWASLGPISVTGFAVISAEGGFSLLVLVQAQFDVPIQLSFGFTLAGVGGLVGINRRPDVPALFAAASSGDMSRLMFPTDLAGEADHLLPVLSACFPRSAGSIVVGPVLKLGWGTPTLVAATVGVLASNQGVVVVGRVAITLPFEQLALIRLEAVVMGTITGNGLTLGASLTNSQIVGLPVEGDIRLRMRTGDGAVFAFAAGGFHPQFTPPDGMSGMRRIGTEISPGPALRARLGAYVAVTTNSVQFGAHAELEAGFDGFGIKGHFDFDALIVFDPFGFMVDFGAAVSVECADFDVCSISLSGHLSGTSPWRIRGHASFSVLWWDVDVDIPELTWGDAEPAPLPPARDPFEVLAREIGLPANWTATSRQVPHLARLAPGVADDHAAVHPMAEIAFVQSTVPIDLPLQRMDGVPLPAPVTLTALIDNIRPGTSTAQFVPAEFLDIDATAALTGAGYATFAAGFEFDPAGADVPDEVIERSVDPETWVLGVEHRLWLLSVTLVPAAPTFPTAIGHTVFPASTVIPLIRLADPGAPVVTTRAALVDIGDYLVDASGNAAVGVMALADLDAGANGSVSDERALQLARAWELT